MMQKQQSLFENEGAAKIEGSGRGETAASASSVEVKTGDVIEINTKLTEYLQRYIRSYKNINDQIELKGRLIDLIRKM